MTRTELLAKLDANPIVVSRSTPTFVDDNGGVRTYTIQIYETDIYSQAHLQVRTALMYVYDERGAGERAFMEKKYVNGPSQAVLTYLQINVTWYRFTGNFDVDGMYEVDVLIPNSNGLEAKKFILIDDNGTVSHKEVI